MPSLAAKIHDSSAGSGLMDVPRRNGHSLGARRSVVPAVVGWSLCSSLTMPVGPFSLE